MAVKDDNRGAPRPLPGARCEVPLGTGPEKASIGKAWMMSTDLTPADMRRELQQILSEERDLVDQVVSATTSGNYVRLRDLADQLVKVAERRGLLRAALLEVRAREAAGQAQGSARRGSSDQTEDTWRRLH